MKLKLVEKINLFPTEPFNFDLTFFKPDHFTSGDNLWQKGVRWQTWWWKNNGEAQPLGLKFQKRGSVKRPKIELSVYSESGISRLFLGSLAGEIRYRYNLDIDLLGFYRRFETDLNLRPIIKRRFGMRPGQPSSLYEYLIIGVVLQNASVRRSVQMFQVLLKNFSTQLEFDRQKLWCFWSPGALKGVSEDRLRQLKLGYRAKFIKKIDDYFRERKIDEFVLRRKDAKTQKEELLKIYGVGPATVWYLMFDVFHRWDVFDHVSPWEQKIYSKLFFGRDPEKPVPTEKLLKYFNKNYGDLKALAVHYFWEDLFWRRREGKEEWLNSLIRL